MLKNTKWISKGHCKINLGAKTQKRTSVFLRGGTTQISHLSSSGHAPPREKRYPSVKQKILLYYLHLQNKYVCTSYLTYTKTYPHQYLNIPFLYQVIAPNIQLSQLQCHSISRTMSRYESSMSVPINTSSSHLLYLGIFFLWIGLCTIMVCYMTSVKICIQTSLVMC